MIKKFNFSDIILQDNKKEKENTKVIINEIKEESCGCCCEQDTSSLSSPSPSSSINFTLEKSNLEENQRREEKQNKRAKILIIIGLALTIPLVIIELLQYYDILKGGVCMDYFLLSLATSVQILLG